MPIVATTDRDGAKAAGPWRELFFLSLRANVRALGPDATCRFCQLDGRRHLQTGGSSNRLAFWLCGDFVHGRAAPALNQQRGIQRPRYDLRRNVSCVLELVPLLNLFKSGWTGYQLSRG